jgi:ABC-type antimicrobial peptide transport system permease subunit
LFGAVGLILVVVGLYGILSYMVSRRRREIGIRMALGAEAGDVRALVLRDGLRLTLTGVAIGVVLAAVVSYLMRSFLYGLSALDPLTFGGVAVLMVGVAWAACYLPARRATLTAPTEALRSE